MQGHAGELDGRYLKKRRYRDPFLGVRISAQAANKLKAEAAALGVTQSRYLEHLI
jgi:hypothetical protein